VGFIDDKAGEQTAVLQSLEALEHRVRSGEGGREGGREDEVTEEGTKGVREGDDKAGE
jgi:hypothetical protein